MPLRRPPDQQARTVLVLVTAFVVVFLVLAYLGLRGIGDTSGPAGGTGRDRVAPAPSATASATTAAPTPTPTPATPAAAGPLPIASVAGFDPLGDGAEKDDLAALAHDGDPGTSWTSETYRSETYGGLKDGVGLLVDLGSAKPVTSMAVRLGGDGSRVQLRSATGATLDGSAVLAEAADASGTITLRPTAPVTTRFLVLWFVTPAPADGGYRAVVEELSLR